VKRATSRGGWAASAAWDFSWRLRRASPGSAGGPPATWDGPGTLRVRRPGRRRRSRGIILSGDYVRETIQKFRDVPGVKAVVLRINSPGGGVAASQEIYREVVRFRTETKKPVVVSMESVAASGGYYAAAAADHIVANPGTITGSIGVIVQWTNYADLLEWARLRTVTFKSGALKDAGNPTRALSDDERKFFDELIGAMLGQFRQAVTDGRKNRLKPGAMDRLADGRVITGEEALALGFVDEIGDYRDAVDRAAKLAGMSVPRRSGTRRRDGPGSSSS